MLLVVLKEKIKQLLLEINLSVVAHVVLQTNVMISDGYNVLISEAFKAVADHLDHERTGRSMRSVNLKEEQ